MSIIGYARCSTDEQRQDVERQCRELRERGAEIIFSEYASGTKKDREELERVYQKLTKGDTLAVTEVSRLSRKLSHLCEFIELAKTRRIRLMCGALVADFTSESDPMSTAMLQMMGVFAELERGLTVQRIKSGIVNAKENGKTMGRPKLKESDVPESVKELLPEYKSGRIDKVEYARRAGVSRPSLYKYLRILGVDPKKPKATYVPERVRELYPEYVAGNISVTEYARRADMTRNTIYRHVKMLEESGMPKE